MVLDADWGGKIADGLQRGDLIESEASAALCDRRFSLYKKTAPASKAGADFCYPIMRLNFGVSLA